MQGKRDRDELRTFSRKFGRGQSNLEASASASEAVAPLSPPKKTAAFWGRLKRLAATATTSSGGRKKKSEGRRRGSETGVEMSVSVSSQTDPHDEQYFLDLEGSGMAPTRCDVCRMTYSTGVREDEAAHEKHCKRFRLGAKWPKNYAEPRARVVQTYVDGTRIVATPSLFDATMEDVLEVMDTELGFVDDDAPGDGTGKPQMAFVLISPSRHVVACAVTVEIEKAFRVIPPSGDGDSDSIHTTCGREPYPASLGISRIWVHRDHRRKGYGRRILDAVFDFHSKNSPMLISKDQMAFSQPTKFGRALASAWFARQDFLVFK